MKLKKLLGISLVCFCFLNIISCSDDNDDDNNVYLKTEDLYQTVWRGTFHDPNIESSSYEVGLEFTTATSGTINYKSVNPTDKDDYRNNFTYSIEGKIVILRVGYMFGGNWTVTKHNKSNLTMQRNLSSADGKTVATLTLTRVN